MKSKLIDKIEESAHHFLQSIKQEGKETKEATLIVHKYIKTGELTDEEEHIIKQQIFDSLKIIGVIVPFILIPGASIVMPIIIRVANKHGVELLPSSFDEKNHEPYVQRVKSKKRYFITRLIIKIFGKRKRIEDRPSSVGNELPGQPGPNQCDRVGEDAELNLHAALSNVEERHQLQELVHT